ncbi:MAG: TIGR02391 family protein [Candidatus Aminicenantes bacterium]|nr:TIGR02391 family protein [Candidatus Aminicenantes bacterium]
MSEFLRKFELIARKAFKFSQLETRELGPVHPFDIRNIHQSLPHDVRTLFDNGHYSQATFEAFKFVDKTVQHLSEINKSGFDLMMRAFSETSPQILLNANVSVSEKDEQQGYKFIFSGCALGVRNPRGHECDLKDPPELCLDHLCLASMLLRKLESAGYDIP